MNCKIRGSCVEPLQIAVDALCTYGVLLSKDVIVYQHPSAKISGHIFRIISVGSADLASRALYVARGVANAYTSLDC